MSLRSFAALAAPLLIAIGANVQAAAIAQPLTPINESVAGNETQVFAVRFFDALGRPSVGEAVSFANDACGYFPNGLFQIAVTTDATGLASTTFTAMPQGIGCWLVASAGVQVRFNVLTYLPEYAYLTAGLPPEVVPGQPFSFTASAKYGLYSLYNADIDARIVPGTGTATIAPATANTGQEGSATFTVTPSDAGDYQIELQFRDQVQRFPVKLSATPWQDLWWGGVGENGWGMSVVQHRDILFSVIYAYDATGSPTWYVMPGGGWNAAHTVFSGPVYRPHGTPYTAYDAARFAIGEPVGQASIDVTDPANVRLDYTIDGVSGHKSIVRQAFGPVDASSVPDVGDMWWGGPSQNGWGIAVLRQYGTLFCIWFTYDAAGAPTWFVMPSGYWSDAQTWEGRLYRATGSPWLAPTYDASALSMTDVGALRLRFDTDSATFEYTIGAVPGALPLVRQPF